MSFVLVHVVPCLSRCPNHKIVVVLAPLRARQTILTERPATGWRLSLPSTSTRLWWCRMMKRSHPFLPSPSRCPCLFLAIPAQSTIQARKHTHTHTFILRHINGGKGGTESYHCPFAFFEVGCFLTIYCVLVFSFSFFFFSFFSLIFGCLPASAHGV